LIFRSQCFGYTRFELYSVCHRLLLLAEKGRGIGVLLELLDVQKIPLNCENLVYISLLNRQCIRHITEAMQSRAFLKWIHMWRWLCD